jgi:hypothetical protein
MSSAVSGESTSTKRDVKQRKHELPGVGRQPQPIIEKSIQTATDDRENLAISRTRTTHPES